MPETTYNVSVATILRSISCVGNPNTTVVTTLTLAAAEPECELRNFYECEPLKYLIVSYGT